MISIDDIMKKTNGTGNPKTETAASIGTWLTYKALELNGVYKCSSCGALVKSRREYCPDCCAAMTNGTTEGGFKTDEK